MTCGTCEMIAAADDDAVVFADELFSAFQVGDVPGWITLAPTEHVEGFDGLTQAQAAAIGPLAHRLVGALKAATGADRVHVVYLGEHSRHFHLGLFPRRPGQPALFGNELLLAAMGSDGDGATSGAVRAAVRAELSAAAAGP